MDAQLLDLYTDYLIGSFGQITATGLSAATDGTISHDRITRMLSTPDNQGLRLSLYKQSKALYKQIQSDDGVLSIDDTFIQKPHTDENEIVCCYWDHSQGRYIKGINLLSIVYQHGQTSLPLMAQIISKDEVYTDSKTGRVKRRSSITKNEYMRSMLQQISTLRLRYSTVVADVWFASKENMCFIAKQLHKRFVMPIKSNRKVALSAKDRRKGIYSSVSTLDIVENTPLRVYLEGIDFPVVLLKQVFTDGNVVGVLYLVSNDTRLGAQAMHRLYHKRWKIECYHKSLKQNLGVSRYPGKTVQTQRNHIFACLCAFIKLEVLQRQTATNAFALKQKLYLKALCSALDELRSLKQQFGIKSAFA
jgi:hypothetical protein